MAKKSDASRAFSEDGALKTHVGGQALIEGIMMRGKHNWSVAVRQPDGQIYVEEHDLASGKKKNGWMYWPLVRGCRAMVESLALGFKALEIAALHAFDEGAGDGEGKAGDAAEGAGEAGSADAGREGRDKRLAEEELQAVLLDNAFEDEFGGGAGENAGVNPAAVAAADQRAFSWKNDFGRPDTVIDALGAQRTLEVVSEPSPSADNASASPAPADGSAVPAETSAEKKGFMDEEVELGHKEMVISMVFGLVLGIVLFIVAPAFITNLLVGEYDGNPIAWNIVDGILRVGVFVLYLWLIGRMSDIKRMFGYHGAEHKTIHCFEHGLPLTPENARSFPRLHVRCGTAFLIMVMIIAIFVYTVIPVPALISAWGVPDGAPKLALVIAIRILFIPVIAGIAYEITVKWAGSHPDNPLVKVVLWPGMQLQYLTTNEPDDGQIECAIAAMKLVLEREEREEAAGKGGAPADESAPTTAA